MVGVSFLSSDFDSSRVVGPTTLCRRFDYSMMKRFGRHRLLGRKCLAKFRSHWPPLKISAAAAEPGLVVAAQKFPVQQRSPKFGSVQIAMFHCFFRVGSPSDCFLKKKTATTTTTTTKQKRLLLSRRERISDPNQIKQQDNCNIVAVVT